MEIKVGTSIVLIDECDYETVSFTASWYLDGHGYAYTILPNNKVLFMHRLICPDGEVVDHINGNTLDNRRGNLRSATRSQNAANRGKTKRSKTGYKGVFLSKAGLYKAAIRVNYVLYHLGTFLTPEEAALAYDKRAIKEFGAFAKLNLLTSGEQ